MSFSRNVDTDREHGDDKNIDHSVGDSQFISNCNDWICLNYDKNKESEATQQIPESRVSDKQSRDKVLKLIKYWNNLRINFQ